MTSIKKQLGQFFTTNYDYILQNFQIENEYNIIEPFAGNCDLLNFIFETDNVIDEIKNTKTYKIELYDIDPKHDICIKKDTLKDVPDYNNKFIITNPPYLARNKNKDKSLYNKYDCDDLYKCFIKSIIPEHNNSNNYCNGGIIIVPVNFISSIRKKDMELRRDFTKIYNILRINIFEEQVFDDTSYAVCSILFKKHNLCDVQKYIKCDIYPSKQTINIKFNKSNNYSCGGEIYNLPKKSVYTIERATSKTNNNNITNLLLKCIDDSITNKIKMLYVTDEKIVIDNTKNLSARSYMSLVIKPKISEEIQKKLCNGFNDYLNTKRDEYNSLFLTNFRESNTIARKRISFDLIYRICHNILSEL